MNRLKLPKIAGSGDIPMLPDAGQLTIIGGSGAGKTKFMEELVRLNEERAYCLSALSAPFPEREESERPGSIDVLFRDAVANRPYMRIDAVCELDKLAYMILMDEFEYLLSLKKEKMVNGSPLKFKPTRLDKIVMLWERIFPGNKIVRSGGSMMFTTNSGSDMISAKKLSRSEQTVLYYAAAVLYAMPGAVILLIPLPCFCIPLCLPIFGIR